MKYGDWPQAESGRFCDESCAGESTCTCLSTHLRTTVLFIDILSVRYMSGLLCNNEEHVEKRKAAQLISSYHLRDKTSLTFFPCIQCHSNNEPSDTIRNPPKCSPFAMNPLGTYQYVVQIEQP